MEIDELEVTENGTYTAPTGHAYSPVVVNVSGGGGGVEEKQINFFDYDGTLVDSYTAAEWANVSDLPANPSHDGLTAQGWNWTKAQIDTQLTNVPTGIIDVGQMYATTSGATEIDIELEDPRYLNPYLKISPSGTVTVDWGDNTTSAVTGTGITTPVYTQHVYASTGKYTIKISGSYGLYGETDHPGILRMTNSNTSSLVYSNCIKHVRVGNDAYIGQYAFNRCQHLETITIPYNTPQNLSWSYAFGYCFLLSFVVYPSGRNKTAYEEFWYCNSLKGISRRGGSMSFGEGSFSNCLTLRRMTVTPSDTFDMQTFYMCESLQSMILPAIGDLRYRVFDSCYNMRFCNIPSNATSIGSSAFLGCRSLQSIMTIPESVTSIGSSAFQTCTLLNEFHMLRTTPPTLSTSVFPSLPADSVIYVPYSADHSILNAYQTATNWSSYASYIQEEPQ